jgi:hypothetical protein
VIDSRSSAANPHSPDKQSPNGQSPHASPEPASSIKVRYMESSPVRVRGLVTGSTYLFSASDSAQEIDARDAASLLNTRFFRRA